MDRKHAKRVEELFQIAVQLRSEELDDFFSRHCPDDAELRREVETLLACDDDETRSSLKSPLLDLRSRTPSPSIELAERIGPYRILEKIGEGGMGVVFLAEERGANPRKLAIKVIRHGLQSADAWKRLEKERRALAVMDHPGIAAMTDCGHTAQGAPYLVMEYVSGPTLIDYCDQERLGIDARLELFALVCDAAEHAHERAVVHRDLKPSNILVSSVDGVPTPKLIDFGIAFARERRPDEERDTQADEVLGTAYYMSPEQATPGQLHIDARSDVYSLGVMLYELLTGVLPVDASELRDRPLSEIHRILWEQDPPFPSRRLTRLAIGLETLAERRSTSSRRWIEKLSGNLDWIVLRALAKEPARRYQTARAFADDVRRHLAGLPIRARPPELRYRLAKFAVRHRSALIAAAAGLLIAAGARLWDAGNWAGTVDAAEESARKAETSAHLSAENLRRGSRDSDVIARFFLLATLTGSQVDLHPDALRDVLSQDGWLEHGLNTSPRSEAVLYRAVGRGLNALGRTAEARRHLTRARDLVEEAPDSSLEDLYEVSWELTQTYGDADSRARFLERVDTIDRAIDILVASDESLRAPLRTLCYDGSLSNDEILRLLENTLERLDGIFAPSDPRWLVFANMLEVIGRYLSFSEPGLQLPFLLRSLAIRDQLQPELDPDRLHLHNAVVSMLIEQGDFDEAERRILDAEVRYAEILPPGHWLLAVSQSLLGDCRSRAGVAGAEQLLLEGRERVLAARGLETLEGVEATYRVLHHYERQQRREAAEEMRGELARALAYSSEVPWHTRSSGDAFGPAHAQLGESLDNLINDYWTHQELNWLERHLRECVDGWRELERGSDLAVLVAHTLGRMHFALDKTDPELLQVAFECVLQELSPNPEHFREPLAHTLRDLAKIEAEAGHLQRAEVRSLEALDHYAELASVPTLEIVAVEALLAENLRSQGRAGEGRERLERLERRCAAELGELHGLTTRAHLARSRFLASCGEAQEIVDETVQRLEAALAQPSSPSTLIDLVTLVTERPDLDQRTYDAALTAAQRASTSRPWNTAFRTTLGCAYYRAGDARRALVELGEVGERAGDARLAAKRAAWTSLALLELGQTDEARRVLDRALIAYDGPLDYPIVAEARMALRP